LARIEFWAEPLFGFLAAFSGDLKKQENKKEEQAQDSDEAQGFVVGDGVAEDGFEGLVAEEGFVEGIKHACDKA
jgi:hypothetical protein